MTLSPGTIAHWRDFSPGNDKFVYILGIDSSDVIFSFTISSQVKYLSLVPHKSELIEIPFRTTDFLDRRSFIQCFFEVTRTSLGEFRELERKGAINWRGCMPEFLSTVARIVKDSRLLSGYDQDAILDLLRNLPHSA
jgi:hypothetical protein